MKSKILVVEDYAMFKTEIVEEFDDKPQYHIKAPSNIDECEKLILSGEFKFFVLDFKLTDWFKDGQDFIKLENSECHDGVEIAEYLLSKYRHSDIKIGMYSSDTPDLKRRLETCSMGKYIEVIEKDNSLSDLGNEHVIKFITDLLELKMTIKSPVDNEKSMPKEIQSFYSKKILYAHDTGPFIWKAGEFFWIGGTNATPQEYPDATLTEKQFTIQLDHDFCVHEISDLNKGSSINAPAVLDEISKAQPDIKKLTQNRLLYEYFVVRLVCIGYLDKKINEDKAISVLGQLSTPAIFESQKLLFKKLSKDRRNFQSKEAIYDALSGFREAGFPHILDIYKGRVGEIDEDGAFSKLSSLSSPDIVRIENFKPEIAAYYHLSKDCEFEYTIYIPDMGGNGHHIELI